MPLNTKQIQEGLLKHFFEMQYPFCCQNFQGVGYDESDIIVVSRAGIVIECEVKISRADFRKDMKKTQKHWRLKNGIFLPQQKSPNKFFYACPEGLIKPEEVPEYAGLIYVNGFTLKEEKQVSFEIKTIKKAPYIHRIKSDHSIIYRMCRTLSARAIYGCALMTYKNRRNAELFNLD